MKINRFQIMQLHMLLAAFLLPIAIMYFISGALYTLDFKGKIAKQTINVQLQQPFTPNLELLADITAKALVDHQLVVPGGEATLRKKKSGYELNWSDLQYAVKLQPTKNPMVARITVRKRSFLAQLMRIHRADAGVVFKVFAIILVTGLLVMFATGIYMAHAVPKLRRPAYMAIGVGLLTFLALILI